jgi:transcriptional regulator with XRE-family HTH domain
MVQGEGTNPQVGKVTVEEFARKIKEKYPQYKDVDDLELAQRIIDKYPQYKKTVSFEPPAVKKKDAAIPSAPLDGASPSQEYTEKDFFTGTFGNILKSVDEANPWLGLGDFIDDMGRSVYTGYKQGVMAENAADILLRGGQSTPEDIASFLEANKELQQIGSSKEMMEYQRIQQEEGGFWGVVKGIAANPSVLPEIMVSSFTAMASDKDSRAAFAAALGTGAGYGAGVGSTAGGVGALPGAVGGTLAAVPYAFSAAGAAVEMGATFAELLQEELGEGVELTKENVRSVLEDQEAYKRIRNKAVARGLIIGTVDLFTGKLAGSVGAKIISKGGARPITQAPKSAVVSSLGAATAIEGVGGSAGEAAARLAIGQEMDISEIALEGIAELPGGVRNVITKAVTPAQYKINGERVDVKTAEDVINTMTLSELNSTKISIKNDYTGLQSKLDQKKKKLATRAAVQKANPNLNEQQLNEITDLQLELFEISDNKTEAGKEKTKALKSQINDISNRVEPVKTEQKIAEPTTEEAIEALNEEGIAATEESIANKKKEIVVLRQAEAQAEPVELQFTDQYNEDEVAVADVDTSSTAENSRAETERVKQSPIEEEDGTTLNLDGTTYEGDGLVVPFASDDFKSEEVTPELIAEFVEKNKNKIPKGAKVVVGLYSFKGEDKVSIDLNVVVDEGNLAVATEFARLMGQNSIYRISDGQTVPTGETGNNTVTLMDARARQAAIAITQGKLPQYLKGIRSPSEMAAYKAEQDKAYKKSQEKPKKQDYIDVKDLGKDERTPKGLTESKIKKLQTMVDNFNKIIKKIGAQPYNITFVTSNEQYKARYRELTGREKRANRGTFIGRKREIIINLSNSKGLTRLSPEGTLAHEMMHAYLHALNITGKNILQLTNALYTELSTGSAIEKQIARELRKFQDEYIKRNIYGKNKTLDDPNIAEEFLTEYVGIMVQYSDRIPDSGKVSFAEKIRRAVLKFLTKLGIKDKSILKAIETREEAVNFINGFVNVLSDRAGIETLPTIDVKVQETADPYRAQRSEMEQIETPAGSRLFNEPLKEAADLSRSYMDSKGIEYKEGKPFNTIDEKQAKRISDAFDAMKDDPTNPEVAAAYKALAEETIDQFEFIVKAGYNVEINNNEPYSSSGEMIEDLRTNKRMKIFSTESGFGDEAITEKQRSENPLLQRTKYKDVNGEPLLVNDLFRFVHDFFGHAKRGNGFGAKGEENAWDVHSRMYSPQARRAMTSETRGQNSYVNFSGVNDEAFALRDKARKLRKEGKTEEAAELVGKVYEIMKFADQKVGLLPDEFVKNPYDNAPTLQEVSEDGEAVSKEQIDDSVFGKIKGTEKISKAGNQSTVRTKSGEELQNMKAEDILGDNFSPSGQATSFLANMSRGLFSYKKKGKIVSIPIAFESNSLFKSIESALKKYKNPKSTKAYPSKVKYKNHIKNDVLRPAVESASFQFKEFMKANIRQLYYSLTPEFIDASKRWYDGANRIANRLAEEYDISADQSAGILAVLSPQNDWFNNIENARQFLEVVTKYKEVSFDKDLLDAAAKYSNSKSSAPGDSEFIKRLKGYFEKYNGMSIADIEKIETDQGVDLSLVKANMVRAISMAKLPQTVNEFAPDGNVAGLSSSPHIWMTDNVIANAFGIYNDPKNTSKYLGNGNKVRNFYNNIADPNSKDGYLTADTHALAVALNVPTSAADAGGFGLFGGEKSFKYALVKDAYIEVAEELGILPRQLQSVTWEAVRTGLNEKSRKNKSKTHKLINKLKKSTLNYDERAKEIIRINPSDTPAWARKRGLTTQKTASELRQVSWSKLDEKASDGSISSRRMGDLRGRDSKLGGEPEVKEQIDWQRSEFGRGQVNPAIVNRTTDVQQAAVDLLEGKITNKEYQDTVKFTQTIEAITRFFLPASTKDMKESLDSNKAKLLNEPIEDGTEIGLRLDIPAYKNKNIWIVSVHDKGKSGKSISYGSVAWATDVNFGSNPKVAAFIAAGRNMDTLKKQDKTTIARMLGKWKNFEGKTKEERDAAAVKKVEEIVAIENKYPGANRTGSPWRQIGMNPFRHSFFYDRRNGKPVVYASEVVQIGGLVYAKDVVYADKTDPMFEVEGYKDAEGETVRFQIDEKTNEAFESRQSIGEKIFGADVDSEVDNQVSQNGSWKSRPRSMFERFVDLTRLRIQDKFRRIMIVQEDIEHSAGKPVGLDQDFRNAEALMHGKAKEELNKSEEKVSKIASLIKAAGIKLEKFNELLYAMHAQERNRYLRIASTDVGASLAKLRKKLKIKPSEIAEQLGISTQEYLDIEANKEVLTTDNLNYLLQIYGTSSSEFFYENAAVKDGSGMTDKEARTILAEYGMDVVDPESSQLPTKLRAAVEAVYDLTADTRQRLLDSGLETPETIEVFETTYKNYVPLRGFAEGDLDSEIIEGGRKIEVRGREKRAKGRKTKADDPLTQAIIANTTTIIRAEKNSVMNRFYNLAKNNPNEDVYKVIDPKVDKEYKTEDRGGKLRRTAKTVADYLLDPNVVAVRVGGDYKFIRFKDKRLADALRGANVVKADFMVKYLGKFNRMLSSFITTYDPEFVLRNFSRDIQTAVMNLYAEQEISEGLLKDKNIVNDVIADTLPALRAIFAVEGGITGKKKGSKNKEMDQYYREFKEDGAKTEWFYSKSSSEVQNDIENLIKGKGTNAIQAAGNLVERINSSVENAVRLSTYVNARKAGVSRAKAAELAKGLTVNFNKSGEWGQIGNTLYLFFNASVQGTSRLIRALKPRYKVDSEGNRSLQVTTAQKMAIGLSILGSLLSVLNELNSDDDEDGESFYSKIADFEKERNIIIMKPNGKDYFKIPLPYGVNVFYVAGTLIADATQKIKTPGEAAVGIMEAALGSFSPINFPTSSDVPKFLAKFVTPTVGQIPLSLAINENYFGQTIYNDNFPFDTSPKPESELGRKGGNRWTQEFVKFMNKATGGSAFRPGAIDINPDKIDFFMESISGGMGKFVGRSSNVIDKVITGNWDQLEPRQVPFLRVFYGQSPKYANVQEFYSRSVLVNQMYEEVKEKVITDPVAKKKISKMYYLGKNLRKQLKNIKEKEDLAMKIKDPELQQARLEKLESTRYRIVANYNKQYIAFEIDKLK